jgi:transcriptional regulator of acetoin/glycerol metabolism
VTSMRSTDHGLQSVVREMVACSARRIENLYFDQRHARGWVLRLSRHNDFCDVAAEARLALDDSGRIIDATPPALRLLAGTACEGGVESLIGRKLSSVVEIGNVERLLHGPAPVIDGRHGRVHVRVVEQARRSASQRATTELASRAPRPAAGTRSRPAAPSLEEIVGSDAGMVARLRLAQRLHARSLPLLLQGDSGSGKTQLARSLHEDGPHAAGGFVAINCAAIPAELIESELFGHRAGAFTGAARQGSPGRILGADNGTLFLDEIGDMPLGLQGRLLQVLSEGEFVPIGATAPVKVRFALISATLRDLKTLVQEGRFREDLYYRLSGATLVLPPLREREDMAEIIERAFANAALDAGLAECRLSDAARGALIRHRWPGNIRELQHVAKFMVAISDGELIELDCLPAGLLQPADGELRSSLGRAASGRPVSDAAALQAHMEQASWNVSAAAARLGISRATLHRRLNEFDVHRPVKPE